MKQLSLFSIALVGLGCLGFAPSALAAENVVLQYRGFSRTVAVSDLVTLAETGEAPTSLAGMLRQVGQQPETLQTVLSQPLMTDVVMLDKALNSLPGEWMLDQVSQAIRPVSGEASRQALRSALVAAADDDGEVTLLEVLQAYPTETVVLEVDRLQATYNRISTVLQPISRFLGENILDIILRGGL